MSIITTIIITVVIKEKEMLKIELEHAETLLMQDKEVSILLFNKRMFASTREIVLSI
jgi:hypothetical protein